MTAPHRVLIVGASGRTGRRLLEGAAARGLAVTAFVHKAVARGALACSTN